MDYKEKLRLAKEALDSGSYDKDTIEYIFPELAVSEDERIRKKIIKLVKEHSVNHERCQMETWLEKQDKQKSAEWNEEDERTYKSITYSFARNYPLTVQQQEFVKSIKERCTWRPSDEQVEALRIAIGDEQGSDCCDILRSLLKDLKSL